jgi:hypothetical protein
MKTKTAKVTASESRQTMKSTTASQLPANDKRRRLNKGRHVNVPLLSVSGAVVVGLAVAGYFWHRHQMGQLSSAMQQRAEALADQQEWRQAAAYWQRYLWLEPDDFDARLKLVDAVGRVNVTRNDRRRFSVLLHETIGMAGRRPEAQADLQLRVTENQLDMGLYSEAYASARVLLSRSSWASDHPDHAAKLRRVRALAGAFLAREQGQIEPPDVACAWLRLRQLSFASLRNLSATARQTMPTRSSTTMWRAILRTRTDM